jgi:hypothetical protein
MKHPTARAGVVWRLAMAPSSAEKLRPHRGTSVSPPDANHQPHLPPLSVNPSHCRRFETGIEMPVLLSPWTLEHLSSSRRKVRTTTLQERRSPPSPTSAPDRGRAGRKSKQASAVSTFIAREVRHKCAPKHRTIPRRWRPQHSNRLAGGGLLVCASPRDYFPTRTVHLAGRRVVGATSPRSQEQLAMWDVAIAQNRPQRHGIGSLSVKDKVAYHPL